MARKDAQVVYCGSARFEELNIYLAASAKGAVMVGVSLGQPRPDCISYFEEYLPDRRLVKNQAMTGSLHGAVEAALTNRPVPEFIPLDVECTAFQMDVWRTITQIPYGSTRTYAEVARMAGRPLAARAVGQAMGQNPLLLIFP